MKLARVTLLSILLGGCTVQQLKYDPLVGKDGEVVGYVGPPTQAEPSIGADGTVYTSPAVQFADVQVWEKAHTETVRAPWVTFMWGCEGLDMATTIIGVVYMGATELNPIGLAAIPVSILLSKKVARDAEKSGDMNGPKVAGAAHCAAGLWNLAQLL